MSSYFLKGYTLESLKSFLESGPDMKTMASALKEVEDARRRTIGFNQKTAQQIKELNEQEEVRQLLERGQGSADGFEGIIQEINNKREARISGNSDQQQYEVRNEINALSDKDKSRKETGR